MDALTASDEEHEFAGQLQKAQQGETRAFAELVRWLERPLRGFLAARGADDPDGTANEVLVRVFRRIGGFEGSRVMFRAWVFRIARNMLVDEHRRRQARAISVPRRPDGMPEVAVGEDAFDRIGERERVEALLTELTDEQREVLLLRVVAGLSVEETAQAVGRTSGSVRSMQHRALSRLRTSTSGTA
jgi:RNA polymerase sigma-70 factor (ECF subfamily)